MIRTLFTLLTATTMLAACGGSEDGGNSSSKPPPLYENPPFGASDIDSTVNEARERAKADQPAPPAGPIAPDGAPSEADNSTN